MPVEVICSAQHGMPQHLNRALRRLRAAYNQVRDCDPATVIPAVARMLGPMDELIVASEDMHSGVYSEAVKHGATFLILDSSETPGDVLKREYGRVGERFVAETCHSAFSAALDIPHDQIRNIYKNIIGVPAPPVNS